MADATEANPGQPIEFFNRRTGRLEIEQVYGEKALRWAYENPLGKLTNWVLVRRAWLARWYGWWMRQPQTKDKILPFIEKYRLDPAEFALRVEQFASFDDFFSRQLRAGARPIDTDADAVVFGADGRHLGFPDASAATGVFVKGQCWNLELLLGDAALARTYAHGTLVLSRLCPVDYHRFHFPTEGTPGEIHWLPGSLWSVNPIALRQRLSRLWENKRTLTILDSPRLGKVLLLEIGATNVGSITQTYTPGKPVTRGDEKGHFSFGGSATISIFEPGRVRLEDDLVTQTQAGRELYAWMGSRMAVVTG